MALFDLHVSLLFVGVVVVYLAIILGISVYSYFRTDDEADFLVAGRETGPIVGAAALSATQISAGTFVGTIGIHYLTGVSWAYLWIGLWAGWLVSLIFVGPQMRQFGALTVPDFMAIRFGDDGSDSRYMRSLSALFLIIGYTVYLTAQYTGATLIFQSVFGVAPITGLIIMGFIVIVYTLLGGMRASMLTDFVQMMIMIVASFISIPIIFHLAGGFSQLNNMVAAINPQLVGMAYTPIEIGSVALAFGLGRIAAPNEIIRMYSMRDEQTVRQAISLTIVFQVVIATSIAILGVGVHFLYPQLSTADLASIVLSVGVLGPVLGALLISAILSGMLSTINGVMMVTGAALAHDIYSEIINPDAGEKQKLWANRIGVVILGIIPLIIAINPGPLGEFVQFIVLLQAALFGAAFSIPILLGLHWKRANTPGTFAGMVLGFVMVFAWHFLTQYAVITGRIAQFDPVVPGAIASIAGIVIGSYLTSPPSQESLQPFFDSQEKTIESDD